MPEPIGKVECPYCHVAMAGPDEEVFYDEDEFEMRCDPCGKYFDVIAEVSIAFSSQAKETDDA